MERDQKDEESQLPVLASQRKNSNASFCDICFESYHIMGRWPMFACPNDHFFCDICIEGMFRISENEPVPCPICRDLIRHSKVRPHYDLFRSINKQTHVKEALKDEQNQLFSYAFRHQIFEVAAAFKSGKVDSILKLSKLDCGNRRIRKIQYMGCFPGLSYLRMDKNQLTQLSGLQALVNLRYLNLSHNNIADIGVLGGFKKLTHLALEFNQIQEITSLLPFANLWHLFLFGNPLKPIVIDELLLVEFKHLLSLSLTCVQEERVAQVFLNGVLSCKTMPNLLRVFIKNIEEYNPRRYIENKLRDRLEIRWLTMEEALSVHSKWLDELMTENEQFGEVFQFKADPDSPYLEQYKLDGNQIAKVGNNFVTLNSSDTIRKEGKINFKIKLEHPSEHMLMGLCNAFLRHDANIYSQHFVGITFWNYIYARGESSTLTGKLRLEHKPVIRMSVDFEGGWIRWFSDDNQVAAVPFPQQFKHSTLYFLIGMRDPQTRVTLLKE